MESTTSFDVALMRLRTAALEASAAWQAIASAGLEPGGPAAAIRAVLRDGVESLSLVPDEVTEYQRHPATYGSDAYCAARFDSEPGAWAS